MGVEIGSALWVVDDIIPTLGLLDGNTSAPFQSLLTIQRSCPQSIALGSFRPFEPFLIGAIARAGEDMGLNSVLGPSVKEGIPPLGKGDVMDLGNVGWVNPRTPRVPMDRVHDQRVQVFRLRFPGYGIELDGVDFRNKDSRACSLGFRGAGGEKAMGDEDGEEADGGHGLVVG